MPTIRVNRLLPLVVFALASLFAVLEPPGSRGLGFLSALGFWLLHIGAGMLLAVGATGWMSRGARPLPRQPWLRVVAGGVMGSLLFAPLALALEGLLPVPLQAESPDDLLDQWEAGGGALAVFAEWLQLAPSYLASWLLLNAVPLAAMSPVAAPAENAIDAHAAPALPLTGRMTSMQPPCPPPQACAEVAPSGESVAGDAGMLSVDLPVEHVRAAEPAREDAAARSAFLAQLPPAIGRDLITIQADLHYLQVRTTRGRATVLASIAAAESALAAEGLRVHRSHWVAVAHVVRVARTARGTFLTLSDGGRVPVSRRRVGEVQARLGRGFVVDPV